MKRTSRNVRIFFDLNHPADFHFFKNLISMLEDTGYKCRIMARDKDMLHELLNHEGMVYQSRGKGSHLLIGKYLYGIYILIRMLIVLFRFRPFIAVSLSSPYLIVASKFLGIPTITYDDTDINPKLHPLISRSDNIFSPATYPHLFHQHHFHLDTFKELAYIHSYINSRTNARNSVFFRLTRTDSIHHFDGKELDLTAVKNMINKLLKDREVLLSSEEPYTGIISDDITRPDRLHIHYELLKCIAFWGNSPTMAAEAALLGIPAVLVGSSKFAYIDELENCGLLFFYSPDQIEQSFTRLENLLEKPVGDHYEQIRDRLLKEKIDIVKFLYWFITEFPKSRCILETKTDWQEKFRLTR